MKEQFLGITDKEKFMQDQIRAFNDFMKNGPADQVERVETAAVDAVRLNSTVIQYLKSPNPDHGLSDREVFNVMLNTAQMAIWLALYSEDGEKEKGENGENDD